MQHVLETLTARKWSDAICRWESLSGWNCPSTLIECQTYKLYKQLQWTWVAPTELQTRENKGFEMWYNEKNKAGRGSAKEKRTVDLGCAVSCNEKKVIPTTQSASDGVKRDLILQDSTSFNVCNSNRKKNQGPVVKHDNPDFFPHLPAQPDTEVQMCQWKKCVTFNLSYVIIQAHRCLNKKTKKNLRLTWYKKLP